MAKLEWSHPLVARQLVPREWLSPSTPALPVPSALENWRFGYFGSMAGTGAAADDADPDHDGEPNLLEFATGQDPRASRRAGIEIRRNGGEIETGFHLVFPMSGAAASSGLQFVVEWSADLSPGSWITAGPPQLESPGEPKTMRVSIPAQVSPGRCFARLRIDAPPP